MKKQASCHLTFVNMASLLSFLSKKLMPRESLIQTLTQCVKHCRICTQHCLEHEDLGSHRFTLHHSIVCGNFCDALMRLLTMNSPYAARAAAICAEMCNECAAACSTFPDEHYQDCAVTCQETAEQCDEYIREADLNE